MSVIVFYVSLILIIALITAKYYHIGLFEHEAIADIVSKNEQHIHKIAGTSKEIASKIHFGNFQKLIVRVADFLKKEMILLKRKFDSKQPKFLLKLEQPNAGGKHSVSFFLKNISEHKHAQKKTNL